MAILVTILDITGIIRNPKKINSQIKEYNEINHQPELTNTFDGQFQKMVKENLTKQKVYMQKDLTDQENNQDQDYYINTPIK